MKGPLHDWVCDHCGRKVYGRRKVPKRCHAMPMRPLGSPWKNAADAFYAYFESKPGALAALAYDYWVSPRVLERLQIIAEDQGVGWQSSVRRKPYLHLVKTYEELAPAPRRRSGSRK